MPLPTADIKRFVSSVAVGCPEISSVWSMDHAGDEPAPTTAQYELLAFADKTTLQRLDRKSTRLNSSHTVISYAVFCLKKKRSKHASLHVQRHSDIQDLVSRQ